MKTRYVVNHVMSKEINSGIFTAILNYFNQYGSDEFEHRVSTEAAKGADIYHYHRPHLESKLPKNSVCTVHHDLNDPDPWHAKFRFIPRYMESSAVVCLNQSQKEILIDLGIDEAKLHVIAHGYHEHYLRLKSDASRQKLGNPASKVTLGMASRRYGRRVKGEAYLLELAKRLDPDYFDFVFVGEDRTLSTIAMRKLGFDAVAYERLPYRMFQSFYEKIDILLMCSSHEGGPANAPEAIATGTPMFSSCLGIPKDTIQNGANGLFLTLDPDTDAENMMDICVYNRLKLLNMLEHAGAAKSLAITWRESVLRNLAVYKNILGKA